MRNCQARFFGGEDTVTYASLPDNYRLAERFRWWESTRTPVNACPLNVFVVPVERIYQDIPEFRTQVRDGRKLGRDGLPITKKGDKHPNIVDGYVQWQTVQLADLKNTLKLLPRYKKLHSQILQDVINRVETAFSNFIKPNKNGERSGKPRFVRCSKLCVSSLG